MPQRLRLVVPHAVMLAASALLYWAATRIEADTGGRIGPAVWPKTIIAFMALICVYEIGKRLIRGNEGGATGLVENMAGEDPPVDERHPGMLAGGIGLVIAYVVAAPWLGFFVTTVIFLALFPWIGGFRRPWLALVLGLAGTFLLVVVFMRVAYVSLPLGEGPFRALSIALMRLLGVT